MNAELKPRSSLYFTTVIGIGAQQGTGCATYTDAKQAPLLITDSPCNDKAVCWLGSPAIRNVEMRLKRRLSLNLTRVSGDGGEPRIRREVKTLFDRI